MVKYSPIGWRAGPKIVHEDCDRFARGEQLQGEFHSAEILRAIDHDDISRLQELWQKHP